MVLKLRPQVAQRSTSKQWSRIDAFKDSATLKLQSGFRSKLEVGGAEQLDDAGVPYTYEQLKLKYTVPPRDATYVPDFLIGNPKGKQIILEFKGWPFEADARQKMLLVKEQHPDKDIRLVFQNCKQRLYSGSKTTVSDWASQHGFLWADKGIIPGEWIDEVC